MRNTGSSTRTNDLARPPAVGDRQKKNEKKRYPGCLARVVSGMFHGVVANRRQPNLYVLRRGGIGDTTGETIGFDYFFLHVFVHLNYTRYEVRGIYTTAVGTSFFSTRHDIIPGT